MEAWKQEIQARGLRQYAPNIHPQGLGVNSLRLCLHAEHRLLSNLRTYQRLFEIFSLFSAAKGNSFGREFCPPFGQGIQAGLPIRMVLTAQWENENLQ